MNNFLILPNQLFDKKYLDKKYKFTIYEHPDFFTKYNFNKKKLVIHRASMKYYFDYLKKNKFIVKYVEFNEKLLKKEYTFFDPINKMKLKGEMLETPNFILTKELFEKYRKKTDKFFHFL
jgi:deoxyribodipyrimidine photolyase-related protein